jgi:hypothetical protein
MQAKGYLHGSVSLSTEHKGKPRRHAVWILRYRLPSGKDSRLQLGRAWRKTSRPPAGFMTKAQAEAKAQTFLDAHADDVPDARRTFGAACEAFLLWCERERGLRQSTLHDYRRITKALEKCEWRGSETWEARPLDTFTEADLLALRSEMVQSGKGADTVNHFRRILRGFFGTGSHSPVLAWRFMAVKPAADGKLHFYTPAQVAALKAAADSELGRAVYTLAVEAGPRQSEIRALRVGNVDFGAGRIRLENGYTTRGGMPGRRGAACARSRCRTTCEPSWRLCAWGGRATTSCLSAPSTRGSRSAGCLFTGTSRPT